MKDKKIFDYPDFDLDDINSVTSATECTGLMQIPPSDIDVAEAYSEIYPIPIQINNIDDLKTNTVRDNKKVRMK